jgi:hypothetical protein
VELHKKCQHARCRCLNFWECGPRDAALAPRSLSIVSPRILGLQLSGFHSSSSPTLNWRLVEDEAEFACSQVTVAEKLLHETLASVHRNILPPVWVSLKRETKFCSHSNDFLHALFFPVFCSRIFYLGAARMCPRY